MECKGGEVEVATDLVLELHDIREVPPGWDGAVGAVNTILP